MTDRSTPPLHRCYAELPSGDVLVPGVSGECPGPDAFGACAFNVQERPCGGATWRYPGLHGWRFVFRNDSDVCPVTILDPLGPLPVPQD
jgi:hypothetical protein